MTLKVGVLFLALVLATGSWAAAAPRAFVAGSLGQIEREQAGHRFVLMIWETQCLPCRQELEFVGRLNRERQGLKVVLVATDDIAQQEAVAAVLAGHGLEDLDAWIFADANLERLRYSIDPAWFGELPRSYFYEASGRRRTLSGRLDASTLRAWLEPAP